MIYPIKMPIYEIIFYNKKNSRTGITSFNEFSEAADYLAACVKRYISKGNYVVNTNSMYSITVLDLSPDEVMIQMLGHFDTKQKNIIVNVISKIHTTNADDEVEYMKFN